MNNPTTYTKPNTLGDLLISTHLRINAKLEVSTEAIPLGTPLIVVSDDEGYTASVAPANEANGILLENCEETSKVGVLISGEIKASFYKDKPLSNELRTNLLKNQIVLY
ncbi:hypothetical protein [Helicobacter sp. UBA3407]|uniref:hypothetical protein n=1 Tax=Helicobacter TaxID=209 RepID=UPI0026106BCB|nr:hypothetical protein [Helicobacter sp. UBA3407]